MSLPDSTMPIGFIARICASFRAASRNADAIALEVVAAGELHCVHLLGCNRRRSDIGCRSDRSKGGNILRGIPEAAGLVNWDATVIDKLGSRAAFSAGQ